MKRFRIFTGWLTAASIAAAVGAGCTTTDESTQVTVAITSETQIPKELNQLEVVVVDSRGSEASRILHDVQNPGFFPATLSLIPRNEDSLEGPVRVEVRGQLRTDQGETITAVLRRATISYAEGRNLLLPMPLRMACFAVDRCGPDETCEGGTCQPANKREIDLVDFREELVFGAAAGQQCFSEEACLSDSTFVPLATDTPDDVCEVELPPDTVLGQDGRPRINVSIQWAVAPERVIALDEGDPIEGWTFTDDQRIRMSEGVCLSLRDVLDEQGNRLVPDEALGVFVSTACEPKRKLQPFCRASDGHVAIGATLEELS
ncbi:MAG: hypothetical protein ACOC1F_04375 [Myxococcota bacterium]